MFTLIIALVSALTIRASDSPDAGPHSPFAITALQPFPSPRQGMTGCCLTTDGDKGYIVVIPPPAENSSTTTTTCYGSVFYTDAVGQAWLIHGKTAQPPRRIDPNNVTAMQQLYPVFIEASSGMLRTNYPDSSISAADSLRTVFLHVDAGTGVFNVTNSEAVEGTPSGMFHWLGSPNPYWYACWESHLGAYTVWKQVTEVMPIAYHNCTPFVAAAVDVYTTELSGWKSAAIEQEKEEQIEIANVQKRARGEGHQLKAAGVKWRGTAPGPGDEENRKVAIKDFKQSADEGNQQALDAQATTSASTWVQRHRALYDKLHWRGLGSTRPGSAQTNKKRALTDTDQSMKSAESVQGRTQVRANGIMCDRLGRCWGPGMPYSKRQQTRDLEGMAEQPAGTTGSAKALRNLDQRRPSPQNSPNRPLPERRRSPSVGVDPARAPLADLQTREDNLICDRLGRCWSGLPVWQSDSELAAGQQEKS